MRRAQEAKLDRLPAKSFEPEMGSPIQTCFGFTVWDSGFRVLVV